MSITTSYLGMQAARNLVKPPKPKRTVSRLKVAGHDHVVSFDGPPNESDIAKARLKLLRSNHAYEEAKYNQIQDEIRRAAEEDPESLPMLYQEKKRFLETGRRRAKTPVTNEAYYRNFERNEVLRKKADYEREYPERIITIVSPYEKVSFPFKGELTKEAHNYFVRELTKLGQKRGLKPIYEPRYLTNPEPEQTMTQRMVDTVKNSPLGQWEENGFGRPEIQLLRGATKGLKKYGEERNTSGYYSADQKSPDQWAAILGGGLVDDLSRPIVGTTKDVANTIYDWDAPGSERALSGLSLFGRVAPLARGITEGTKAYRLAQSGLTSTERFLIGGQKAVSTYAAQTLPLEQMKRSLDAAARGWRAASATSRAGGNTLQIASEAIGAAKGRRTYQKVDAHIMEEASGRKLHSARREYHRDLQRAVRARQMSRETAQNLMEFHDVKADEWSRAHKRPFSEYFHENAPRMAVSLDDLDQFFQRGGQHLTARILPGDDQDPTHLLSSGFQALKDHPEDAEKILDAMSQLPGFKNLPRTIDSYVNFIADNYVALLIHMPKELREASQHWFQGAHKVAKELAEKYDLPIENVGGAMAALSASKQWEHTASQTERILKAYFEKQHHMWDLDMEDSAIKMFGDRTLRRLRGKSLSELSNAKDKAKWIRIYDRAHYSQEFDLITPNGRFVGKALNKGGEQSHIGWPSYQNIEKAIRSIEAKSIHEISPSLGRAHKVRNFYNNIVNPWTEHDFVTSDVHHVAGGHLSPLSQSDTAVSQNFGKWPPDNSSSGIVGTYAIYQEAANRAARNLGYRNGHELQSMIWQAAKARYGPAIKSNPLNKLHAEEIWRQLDSKSISTRRARQRLIKEVGQQEMPEWAKRLGLSMNRGKKGR